MSAALHLAHDSAPGVRPIHDHGGNGAGANARLVRVAAAFRSCMESPGLDLDDPNLAGTDHRVARAYQELFAGLEPGAQPRLSTFRARRPQLQERMTQQIAKLIDERVAPAGVIVVVEARHLCMEMRGVSARGVSTRGAGTAPRALET